MDEPSKRCCTCHRDLTRSSFNRRAAAGDGLQARCRDCARTWYEANRAAHVLNVRRRNDRARLELQVRLAAYFAEHPCVDCGESDVRCLDFDHRDGSTKDGNVGRMLACALSWARLQSEIEKCEVRCANCHRRVTAERGGWWRQVLYEQVRAEFERETHARLGRVFAPR